MGATAMQAEIVGRDEDRDRVAVVAQSQTRPPLELTFGELREIAGRARASGDEVVLTEPVTGHGDLFYRAMLEQTLNWAFGAPAG